MPQAVWNGAVIADSDHSAGDIVTVEGNAYFPPDSLVQARLTPSPTRTVCGWKGVAHYYHVEVDGQTNADAAWFYPEPTQAAENIRNYVAFWRGVQIR